MQWRRQAISDAYEPHGHHCRFARSTGHFRGRQFFQRGDATRQSRRRADRPRWTRNAPMSAPDCMMVRGRCRPDCACTIRTKRVAARHAEIDRHSENAGRPRRDECNDNDEDGGDDGYSGDDGDDDHALRRSIPTHIAQPLQLRWYALTFILCGGDRFSAIRRAAFRGTNSFVQRRDQLHETAFRQGALRLLGWPKCGGRVSSSAAKKLTRASRNQRTHLLLLTSRPHAVPIHRIDEPVSCIGMALSARLQHMAQQE